MMNRVEMNETSMAQVNGGKTSTTYKSTTLSYQGHKDCGGELEKISSSFYKCKKCGEIHHNRFDFKLETVWCF